MLFHELGLIEPILKALNAEGYTNPTPIQQQAIPYVLKKRDLLGCAQTGTGKTAAFALPIIQLLQENKPQSKHIRTLILTPTRELAIQIDESFASYGKFAGTTHTVIFGGVSQMKQTDALRKKPEVLIATPGRLLDLMDQGYIDLRSLEILVLDEADRMLDMGFINDVRKIIGRIPAKRQTLFFSATMPNEIQRLADSMLKDPAKVEVTPPSSTVDKIDQSLYYAGKADKMKLLLHLLEDRTIKTALVFTRTKHGADKVVKFLSKSGVKSAAIHGNKSQGARQNALSDFKAGKLRTLVATDIAARGIDIDELSHVFNFDLPNVPETYVHRIGRTGRAGNTGIAISFCDQEQKTELKDIEKLIRKKIPVVSEHPFALTGMESEVRTDNPKPGVRAPRSSQQSDNRQKWKPRNFQNRSGNTRSAK
jgi:ATP-dependent RNA helicase RhlE